MKTTSQILIAVFASAALNGSTFAGDDVARHTYRPGYVSTWAAAMGLPSDGAAEGQSADVAYQRMLQTYRGPTEARWVNNVVPEASGDYVAKTASADQRLDRIVAAYTRETLDRGGWYNSYAPDTGYSAPDVLVAVNVGNGVTTQTSDS